MIPDQQIKHTIKVNPMITKSDDLTFSEHFAEFRKKIIITLIFFIIFFGISWFFRNDLLNIYLLPLKKAMAVYKGKVVLLKIMDKFIIHLKTCGFFAVLASIPIAYLNVWDFVSPALYKKEKFFMLFFLFGSLIFLFSGLFLSYFYVIPYGFQYLMKYSLNPSGFFFKQIIPNEITLSLSEHIAFTQKFLLIFGFVFQVPLVMIIISKIGLIKVDFFKKHRKILYVFSLFVSALFTPPDPFTMIAMGIPLILLYEFGIFMSSFFLKFGKKEKIDD